MEYLPVFLRRVNAVLKDIIRVGALPLGMIQNQVADGKQVHLLAKGFKAGLQIYCTRFLT